MDTLLRPFKFIYFLSKLIGVAPISNIGSHTYRRSIPALVYSIALTFTLAFAVIISIRNGWTYDGYQTEVVVEAGFGIVQVLSGAHYTMTIFLCWLNCPQLACIVTRMFIFNNKLKSSQIVSTTCFYNLIFKSCLGVLFLIAVVMMYYRIFSTNYYLILYFLVFVSTVFSTYLILLQFTSLLNYYAFYYKTINMELEQMITRATDLVSPYLNQSPHLWAVYPWKRQGKISSVASTGGYQKGKFTLQV